MREVDISFQSISPSVGLINPAKSFKTVDLPEPDSPINAVTLPAANFKLKPHRTGEFLFG